MKRLSSAFARRTTLIALVIVLAAGTALAVEPLLAGVAVSNVTPDTSEFHVQLGGYGDRQAALQCLALDPVITDLNVAQSILDDYLDTYREHLPQFWQ